MSSLLELAQDWLEGFDSDPRRVVYERLYEIIYESWVEWRVGTGQRRRMLDVGAGYANTLMLFAELPWQFVALEQYAEIAERLEKRIEEGIDAQVVVGDLLSYTQRWRQEGGRPFYLTTMTLTTQYMAPDYLQEVLHSVREMTDHLVLDVTNPTSLYGAWTTLKGWKGRNVYYYTPEEIEEMLIKAGFRIDRALGVGLLSPISLRDGYKATVIRPWMVRALSFLDELFPRRCHLCYLECTSVEPLRLFGGEQPHVMRSGVYE